MPAALETQLFFKVKSAESPLLYGKTETARPRQYIKITMTKSMTPN